MRGLVILVNSRQPEKMCLHKTKSTGLTIFEYRL